VRMMLPGLMTGQPLFTGETQPLQMWAGAVFISDLTVAMTNMTLQYEEIGTCSS
jgi:hypothetical protein